MKKLYSLLTIMCVALFAASNASAESLTLNVPDPQAVTVLVDSKPVTVAAGDNSIDFDPTGYYYLTIQANNGYMLMSVTGAGDYGDLYVYNNYSAQLFLNEYVADRVYTVATRNLDEVRTATAKIKIVDNPELVRIQYGNAYATFSEAETELKFDPENEKSFAISATDYSQLYSVKHNGQKLTYNYGYSVTMADGDELEIQAKYPDVSVPLYLTIPEETPDIITRFAVNYSDTNDYLNDGFTVKAGDNITISLNSQLYVIDNVIVNDVEMGSSSYINFKADVDPIYVDVIAHPYGTISFTLNIDDPSHILAYPSQSDYNVNPLELNPGKNALEVSENSPWLYLKAAEGFIITSFSDAEGNELPTTSATRITDGASFTVTTAEKVLDASFAIYVQSDKNLSTAYYCDEATREYVYFSDAGYQVIKFASAEKVSYMVSVYKSQTPLYVTLNGEPIENSSLEFGSMYHTFVPADGDVIKIFDAADMPTLHHISFTTSGSQADKVSVFSDYVHTHSAWQDGVDLHAGSHLGIQAPGEIALKVTVDGEDQTLDNNICHTFVAADHNIEISATSAIEAAVANAPQGRADVFNLQGICVRSAADAEALYALPAGIYIVNGAKVVVR